MVCNSETVPLEYNADLTFFQGKLGFTVIMFALDEHRVRTSKSIYLRTSY